MPHWVLWVLLAFFLTTSVITVVKLRRRPHYDPWPDWRHADGRDAADVATDPGIPAIIEDTTRVISTDDWAEKMSVPAPEIIAQPISVEQAEAWAQQWRDQELARA